MNDIQRTMIASILKSQLIEWKKYQRINEDYSRGDFNGYSRCVVGVDGQHLADSPFILLDQLGEPEVVSPKEVINYFTHVDETSAQELINQIYSRGLVYQGRKYNIIPLDTYFNDLVNAIGSEIESLMRPSES